MAEERRIATPAQISMLNVYAQTVYKALGLEDEMGRSAKPKVHVVEFVSAKCPHCKKYIYNPDSLYNRALRFCMEYADIRKDRYDVSTPEGLAMAKAVGIKEVPRVFVNDREIPTKYLESEKPEHFEILVRYLCGLSGAGLAEVEWEREEATEWSGSYESSFF